MRLILCLALLASCTAPSVAPPTASPPATPTAAAATQITATPAPTPTFRDLKVTAAGEVRGDHSLVVEIVTSQTAGVPSKVRVWDVPIDGAPRTLVSYTRGPHTFTDYDLLGLQRQLSADGRYLVLSDPVDAAGIGLAVIDLVSGTARVIPLKVAGIQPAWSPDGQRIAFEGSEPAGVFRKDAGVWVVSAAGGDERQVAPGQIDAGAGMGSVHGWTDDGKGVIFTQQRDRLSVADVATGAVTRIGGQTAGNSPVALRAKRPSTAIVFDDQTGRGPLIGHVEARDKAVGPGRIVARYGPDEGTFLNEPRWRPGSDELLLFYAFGAGVQLRKELVIVDTVTGARRTQPTPDGIRGATWSADGGRIVYTTLFEARVREADGSGDRALFRPARPAAGEDAFVVALAAFAPRWCRPGVDCAALT